MLKASTHLELFEAFNEKVQVFEVNRRIFEKVQVFDFSKMIFSVIIKMRSNRNKSPGLCVLGRVSLRMTP